LYPGGSLSGVSDLWGIVRKVQATDPAECAHELSSPAAEWIDIKKKDPAAEQFVVQIFMLNYYYGQGRLYAGVAQHQSGFAEEARL